MKSSSVYLYDIDIIINLKIKMRDNLSSFEDDAIQKKSNMKYGTGLFNDGDEFDDLYDEVMEDKEDVDDMDHTQGKDIADGKESSDSRSTQRAPFTHRSQASDKNEKRGSVSKSPHRGFTLIEVLIVIGILAILATLVLVAVNPGRQFKLARDTKRAADIATILSAVSQNIADHAGVFTCGEDALDIPEIETTIMSDQGGFDLAECVVPKYISALPFDPGQTSAKWNTETDYNTGYNIQRDSFNRVTISATGEGEDNDIISVTR